MEEFAWRYHPEFRISLLVDGQRVGNALKLIPSPASIHTMQNYGLLVKTIPGGAMGYVKQYHNGTNWVPAVAIAQPCTFSFWLQVMQGSGFQFPDFFNQQNQHFGSPIFYANNLSATGVIDSNISGNVVQLTSAPVVSDTEKAGLSNYLLSTSVTPGDFTLIRAGKIMAGAPVNFSISDPIASSQSRVTLDLRLLSKGIYVVRLEGTSPVEERVVFDEKAALAGVNGIIELYKDAWQIPAQPREYRIDFPSV